MVSARVVVGSIICYCAISFISGSVFCYCAI